VAATPMSKIPRMKASPHVEGPLRRSTCPLVSSADSETPTQRDAADVLSRTPQKKRWGDLMDLGRGHRRRVTEANPTEEFNSPVDISVCADRKPEVTLTTKCNYRLKKKGKGFRPKKKKEPKAVSTLAGTSKNAAKKRRQAEKPTEKKGAAGIAARCPGTFRPGEKTRKSVDFVGPTTFIPMSPRKEAEGRMFDRSRELGCKNSLHGPQHRDRTLLRRRRLSTNGAMILEKGEKHHPNRPRDASIRTEEKGS